MRQLYPRAREIFLVRDPRDPLASVLAFNARPGLTASVASWLKRMNNTSTSSARHTVTCTTVEAQITTRHACPL